MPTYAEEVASSKQYIPNVVIKMAGKYFALRAPDSGLYIPPSRRTSVASLVLNPTQISPKSVTTTIASYSFKLLDYQGTVSRIVKDRAAGIVSSEVEIYLGRCGVGMDFASYLKLPTVTISKESKQDAGYTFSTTETTDRMNRPLYDKLVRLNGDILPGTTIISVKDDTSKFPSAGFLQLGSEVISYSAKNDTTKTFSGVARGEFDTVPAAHSDNEEVYTADIFEGENPIDLLLQILTSGGGGGAYDVLPFGLGITASLIDVAGIEAIRDEFFSDAELYLAIYNVPKALKFIETEILDPCNLRFTYARDTGKLTLALLDKAKFSETEEVVDHDSITAHPKMEVAESDIVNKITVNFDYDEGTRKYQQLAIYEDEDSIAQYGEKPGITKNFKGVRDPAFVDSFGRGLLSRLSQPAPTIEVKVQMDKSLLNIGDKVRLETKLLANDDGELNFGDSLETVSRSINWNNGDVTLKLGYTSYTGFRLCYLAPADSFDSVQAQNQATLGAGQGDNWKAGWKVRLWDNAAGDYVPDGQVNEIASIAGDVITFVDDWAHDISSGDFRLKFPDYDDAVPAQRLYCFVSINFQRFSKTEKQYTIVP